MLLNYIKWQHQASGSLGAEKLHRRGESKERGLGSGLMSAMLLKDRKNPIQSFFACLVPLLQYRKWKCQSLSRVRLFVTPWTVAHQAPLSVEFSRQEYWSGLPGPPPGDRPDPGIKPRSPALQSYSFTLWAIREAHTLVTTFTQNDQELNTVSLICKHVTA